MGCNCKRKHNVINNLSIPSYVQLGIDAWNKVKDKRFEEIMEEDWVELYSTYWKIYPNSKGQPSKEELLQIMEKVQSYKKQVYVKRK
jgi:succinate dehydrogenase flavin-adding protein (antitoxin of CptAB toxin-antitoxin module)